MHTNCSANDSCFVNPSERNLYYQNIVVVVVVVVVVTVISSVLWMVVLH